jgi:hypothetical protein
MVAIPRGEFMKKYDSLKFKDEEKDNNEQLRNTNRRVQKSYGNDHVAWKKDLWIIEFEEEQT